MPYEIFLGRLDMQRRMPIKFFVGITLEGQVTKIIDTANPEGETCNYVFMILLLTLKDAEVFEPSQLHEIVVDLKLDE